jgi:hypothetical protein
MEVAGPLSVPHELLVYVSLGPICALCRTFLEELIMRYKDKRSYPLLFMIKNKDQHFFFFFTKSINLGVTFICWSTLGLTEHVRSFFHLIAFMGI